MSVRPEINLLVADLLPPTEQLPLGAAIGVVGGTLVLLAAVSAHDVWRAAQTRSDIDVASAVAARAGHEVARLQSANRHDAEREKLKSQLERLIGERQAKLGTLRTLDREVNNTHRSAFSDYFTGVAEAHVQGLWITGVAVDFKADRLQINGAARQPAAVPGFLEQLRGRPAFAGSKVDGVDVRSTELGAVGFEVRGQPG